MLKLNRKHFLTALCLAPALSWAQSSNTVVMYTSAPTEIQNALVPAIKAKLGFDVQLVSAGGGELLKRLRAESARPLADVVVSTGGDVVDQNADLFTPTPSKMQRASTPSTKSATTGLRFL